jgi:GNAT superfamily N-acetyltransferase
MTVSVGGRGYRGPVTFTLERVRYDSVLAQQLIEELQEEYVLRYGGRDETPVEPGEFEPPRGSFLLAYRDGVLVACAGMRARSESDVEVKRMFVRRPFRGRGYARELLTLVEEEARSLGYSRVLMETGGAQPEAMGLYESSGYQRIPGFGHYRNEPQNRCYAKTL